MIRGNLHSAFFTCHFTALEPLFWPLDLLRFSCTTSVFQDSVGASTYQVVAGLRVGRIMKAPGVHLNATPAVGARNSPAQPMCVRKWPAEASLSFLREAQGCQSTSCGDET